ncbi:MAG: indole-3-glycerol phosphate synthase TrpC [Tannerella sp.]|jgi:indole-3-glycerol phosphate synthase|nr:indole-3-glycerol phosphate synthase TrpC [Tannerella sp.]
MDVLEKIVANKRREVAAQRAAVAPEMLLAMGAARMSRPVNSMRRALAQSPSGIIAEFKRRSPSKGLLHADARVEEIVPAYERNGASACSILTDGDFFGGSLGDLQRARAQVCLPLLRKDFIIDEYQLFQARVMGADAVLLIAATLTRNECLQLARTAHALALEVLLEIHHERELTCLHPEIDMLGVNNRNLGTFHTEVENSFRLMERIRTEVGAGASSPLLVSESGLLEAATVVRLRAAGFRGFLIGETFMKTGRPGEALAAFISQMNHQPEDLHEATDN